MRKLFRICPQLCFLFGLEVIRLQSSECFCQELIAAMLQKPLLKCSYIIIYSVDITILAPY